MDDLADRVERLEEDLDRVHRRNRNAEVDKAWEISWTRRLVITLLTYAVIVIYFVAADLPAPFINSVVPAVAFVLATMTLPWFQKPWVRYVFDPETDLPHTETPAEE